MVAMLLISDLHINLSQFNCKPGGKRKTPDVEGCSEHINKRGRQVSRVSQLALYTFNGEIKMKIRYLKITSLLFVVAILSACFMPTLPVYSNEAKPMALIDHQSLVESMVRDDAAKLTNNDFVKAVNRSIARYSKDRPRAIVEDVAAPGGNYLNLPASWEFGFSRIESIEYPIGNVPPTLLDIASYGMYNAPGGKQIMVRSIIAAAESVRISFSIKHTVDEVTDTSPEHEREAIAAWAAAVCCEQLASYYAGDSDSTIQSDSVDHNSKSREFSNRAKVFRKRYFDELGIDPKRNIAAGAVVNMNLPNSRGNDRLTHPNKRR